MADLTDKTSSQTVKIVGADILNEAFESSIGYDMAGTRDTLALVAVAVTSNSNIYGSFTIREVI